MNIILLLFFIILFLLLIIKMYNIYTLKRLNTINVNKLYNECKTGDVIYFRWGTVNVLHELFCKYTHMGMVLEIDDDKYIIENHPKGFAKEIDIDNEGVQIYKLIDRIKIYDGNMYYSKLMTKIDPDKLNMFYNNIEKYKNIKFTELFGKYILNECVLNKIYKNECKYSDENYKLCSEFVLFCLYELDIVKHNCNCVFPSDFIDLTKDDKKIFSIPEKIDNNIIDYTDLIYHFFNLFVLFGGLFGFLLNNLCIIQFHIIFNIMIIIQWNLNKYNYNPEKNYKFSEDIVFVFNKEKDNAKILIVLYFCTIISTIISIIILYLKEKMLH